MEKKKGGGTVLLSKITPKSGEENHALSISSYSFLESKETWTFSKNEINSAKPL